MDGPAVKPRPASPDGMEHLIGIGLVNDSQFQLPVVTKCKGQCAVPVVMYQVGGSVHRVQDPHRPGKINVAVILFLAHELDIRIQLHKPVLNHLLHLKIHLCHKISQTFYLNPGCLLMVQEQWFDRPYQFHHLCRVNLHSHMPSCRVIHPINPYWSIIPQ